MTAAAVMPMATTVVVVGTIEQARQRQRRRSMYIVRSMLEIVWLDHVWQRTYDLTLMSKYMSRTAREAQAKPFGGVAQAYISTCLGGLWRHFAMKKVGSPCLKTIIPSKTKIPGASELVANTRGDSVSPRTFAYIRVDSVCSKTNPVQKKLPGASGENSGKGRKDGSVPATNWLC